jgi:VCBS repeat-containing protein
MSKSVVPAAAVAHAKHLVNNKKLTKHPKGTQPAASDDAQAPGQSDDKANVTEVKDAQPHQMSMSDAQLGEFSFSGALAEAATGSASLASSSAQSDAGMSDDDDDGSGLIVALGAGALAIGGAIIALSGGGKKNHPPTASAASLTVLEDTAGTVTISATDPDSNPLTYAVSTNPTKGTVTGGTTDGKFTYTPTANANGTDSFVVTVSDGKGGTVQSTVTVTITAVNDAPAIALATQAVTGAEDTAVTGTTVATDVDNATLTYTIGTAAANGTAAVDATGKFTYTPKANFSGTDSFVVKASDGTLSASQTVNVTVTAVNDAPAGPATQTVAGKEDTNSTGTITITDVDNATLTYTTTTAPTNGTVTIDTKGAFTYTPKADFNGTDSFVVKASDGTLSASQTVTINVAAVNDAPTFAAATQAATLAEDTVATGTAVATDVDKDTLTYSIGTAPTNGTAAIDAAGKFTYTPKADFNGTDSFVVNAKDAGGLSANQTVTLTVTPVNDAPTGAATATVAGTEDKAATGTIVITDVDKDTLTYTVTQGTLGNLVVNKDGTFTYTPTKDANGTDTVVVKASDGTASFTQTLTFNVAAVNDAPDVTGPATLTTAAGTAANFASAATDVDNAVTTLTFSYSTPTSGTVTAGANGAATYTPNAGFSGTDSFVITVKDPGGLSDTQAVAVTVTGGSVGATAVSIDKGTPASTTTVDAGGGAFNLTDNANADSFVFISNFTKDDTITVTGATSDQYNFTTSATDPTDLFITYSTGAVVNEITIDGAVSAGSVVFNYATAQAAVGNANFITFA